MIIEEKDFKIVEKEKSFTLFVTKFGKDLKKDVDKYKVYGYYTTIEAAIKAAAKYRNDKKYPGKESPEDLVAEYKKLVNLRKLFYRITCNNYVMILKKRLLNG